jgi:hypothetical protein
MGGLTGGGELHDGAGTPPEWRDAIKWMNWLFRDQRDEELYETFPGEPWLLSCLSPNLGEASATALECSGLECLGPPPPAYLGIVLGDRTASRAVDGEERTAEFGRKLKPWDMFRRLLECGPDGMLKAELQKVLDMESRDEAALRGHKGTVNTIVECLRVEIDADGRGVWRIKEL